MATIRRNDKPAPTPDELREQIMLQIEIKSKACSNPTYTCSLPRIDGYEYCLRHILRDPSGHYKQCSFTYFNGRKCINALPKHDNKKDPTLTTYCFEHSRKAQLAKTCAAVGKLRAVDSNEVLLNSLAHHVALKEKVDHGKQLTRCSREEEIDVVSPQEEPFENFKNIHELEKSLLKTRKRRRVLDYASDSSNEYFEPPCLRNTSHGLEFDNSDDGSGDSIDEDLLKHAEIYTRQEIVRISESKLTKLQGLYISQINQLHHLLKDKRRKYLLALRKEREILCSIHDQSKETRKERILYIQLKAYNTYHQRHGVEAVLHKKFKEKRSKAADGYGYKPPSFTKCSFTEGGVKCCARALPCVKFCRKHILEDKKQSLFRACLIDKAGVVCQEAIPCIFDDTTCVLHMPFPTKRQYIQKKYESETEEDETSFGSAGVTIKREIEDPDIATTSAAAAAAAAAAKAAAATASTVTAATKSPQKSAIVSNTSIETVIKKEIPSSPIANRSKK